MIIIVVLISLYLMNHDDHEFIKISTSNYQFCLYSNRSIDQFLEYPRTLQCLVLFKDGPEMVTRKVFSIHLLKFSSNNERLSSAIEPCSG